MKIEVVGHSVCSNMCGFVGRQNCYYNLEVSVEGLFSTLIGKVYKETNGEWKVMMLDLYCSTMPLDEQDKLEAVLIDYCKDKL